ncbi:nucleotidyltransferase domain-containing protein [Methyloprofundus sp.]|uniref:nucleotidyltransferase domain-containing protein n=1 Tax=Methyloprofundus sp. TaxID=2020875 RepID=UPI003D0F8DCF
MHGYLSKKTLAELKQHNMTIVMQNMRMTAELTRVMQALEENAIEVLAFKGPILAQIAYGDITLRQFGDLDLLCKKEDLYRINTLLKTLQYDSVFKLTAIQQKAWLKHTHDVAYIHASTDIILEMHWSLLDNDYPLTFNLDSIWNHPDTVTIKGQRIKTFASESLLFYLCVHGSKHLWERIEWIKDIDLIIRTQAIDWDKLAKQVNNSGFERMFLLGLSLSSDLFQTPLPTNLQQQINNQSWLKKLSRFVINDWQQHSNMPQQTVAMLSLFPTLSLKLQYLHKIILKPSRTEYSFIDLPEKWYWCYYLVRPYLLIKKYLFKR